MRSMQLFYDPRDPERLQLFSTGIDASVASLGVLAQATLWLPLDLARKLRRDLLERLEDTPPIQRIPLNPALIREPSCHPWCAGASERHSPDECYREHSFVPLTPEPHLVGETGMEPPTIDVELEVHDHSPVIGLAVGEGTEHHRILTVAEARQLAASLVDAADLAGVLGE